MLGNERDEAMEESFPASDPPGEDHSGDAGKPHKIGEGAAAVAEAHPTDDRIEVTLRTAPRPTSTTAAS